jgi:hypothetical protein
MSIILHAPVRMGKKEVAKRYAKKYRKTVAGKECGVRAARIYRLRKEGMSEEEIQKVKNAMFEFSLTKEEKKICPIFLKPINQVGKRYAVDHCHKTLRFRGIVSSRANLILGLVGEDTGVLKRCIEYLERFSEKS